MTSAPDDRLGKLGRRVGTLVFALIVSAFTLTCALQIVAQVWLPNTTAMALDCEAGLKELVGSVEQARIAASQQVDESTALEAFRSAVSAAWQKLPGLRKGCKDPAERRKLIAVERLRYAEEHAVRYNSVWLARQRKRVQALLPVEPASAEPHPSSTPVRRPW